MLQEWFFWVLVNLLIQNIYFYLLPGNHIFKKRLESIAISFLLNGVKFHKNLVKTKLLLAPFLLKNV